MPQVWEFVFLMLILKIPIVYLAWVVYWAIKAEPRPPEYAVQPARLALDPPPPWTPRIVRRPRRRGPHGSPTRGYQRVARARASV